MSVSHTGLRIFPKWVCIVPCSKASSAAIHVLEDTLRWGAESLFSTQPTPFQSVPNTLPSTPASANGDVHMEDDASPRHREVGPDASPDATSRQSPALSTVTSPFSAPEQQHQPRKASDHGSSSRKMRYTDDVVRKLLQWSTAVAAQDDQAQAADAEAREEGQGADAAALSFAQVLGADWSCVRVHKWPQDAFDEELQGDEGTASWPLQGLTAL